MLGLSRLTALILAFALGFSLGAGALVGGVAIALNTITVRDLERNGVPIPDESFIGEDPEVDILDLTAIEFFDEFKELQSFGDDLTINLIQERYALIFPEKLDAVLSDETRQMPLQKLFSMDGVHMILSSVFIGDIEKFKCLNADGTEGGDPKDETSYWVNGEGKRLSGLEEIIADFSLDDFLSGNINTDVLLHGELILADVLGYTFNEELNAWFDSENNKVTGVMAVFADCTIDDVSVKINTVEIGNLIGYEKGEDGNWYNTDENGDLVAVTGFMSKVADGSIEGIDNVFNTLSVGDIVPEEDRTGIFGIISPDTNINDIGKEVNDTISKSPLQFFINEGLITFESGEEGNKKDMSESLDRLSANDLATINITDTDFETQKSYYQSVWTEVKDGAGNVVAYTVPAWRTQPLNSSFAYIISLLNPNV